ncbi:MAG: alpha/beta hydrolase [Alphaproteobacteria bacterium]|nr:MAG: alpha/beta hydrolase [Alphaproteobacteria bacterium]
MPEILFNGSTGRIQGKIKTQPDESAPVALILPPHAQHGGDMDNKVVVTMYKVFALLGFTVLRINYRGVGKSTAIQNSPDPLSKTNNSLTSGEMELNDAAVALDWLQNHYPTVKQFWIGGVGFGAWVGLQLLMRRPEIKHFVAVSPPTHIFDFSFLSPCPVPGLIVHGVEDQYAPIAFVDALMQKMRVQKDISVDYKKIPGADHFFENSLPQLTQVLYDYVATQSDIKEKTAAELQK